MSADDMFAANETFALDAMEKNKFIADSPRELLARRIQEVKNRNQTNTQKEEQKRMAAIPKKERERFRRLCRELAEKWFGFSERDFDALVSQEQREFETLLLRRAKRRCRWVQALTLWPINIWLVILAFFHVEYFFIPLIAAGCCSGAWWILANYEVTFSDEDYTFYGRCAEFVRLHRKYGIKNMPEEETNGGK